MPEWWVISWWAGGVLGAAALVMIGVAMLWDRSRGRRRCPKCWYDMSGAAGLKCPECGREQRSAKRLLRTRRRWRMGMAAVLLLGVAAATAVGPAVYTGTWARYTPVPVLLGLLSFFEKDAEAVRSSFESTGSLSTLTSWERLLLASAFSTSVRAELERTRTAVPRNMNDRGAFIHQFDMLTFRMHAIVSLGPDARVCLPELALCLNSDVARVLAIDAHERMGGLALRNSSALLQTLNQSSDAEEGHRILRALFNMGARGGGVSNAAELVAERYDAENNPVEAFAMRALFKQAEMPSLTPLSRCLSNGSAPQQMIAVSILGRLAHSRDNSRVRVPRGMDFVSFLLGDGGTLKLPTAGPVAGASDLLRQACQHPDADVRQHAQNVLAGIPSD